MADVSINVLPSGDMELRQIGLGVSGQGLPWNFCVLRRGTQSVRTSRDRAPRGMSDVAHSVGHTSLLRETPRPVLDERDSAGARIGRSLEDKEALSIGADVEPEVSLVQHRGAEQWLRDSDG